jgi:glutathione S-transferase
MLQPLAGPDNWAFHRSTHRATHRASHRAVIARPDPATDLESLRMSTRPTLYGTARSRALRALWGAEEVGIDFDHVPTGYGADSKSDDYLGINPNGRIPALVDGELRLFESMAINLYLAQRYGGDLYPKTLADQARAQQWSVWGISEIEPLQMQVVVQRLFTPEEKKKKHPKTEPRAIRGLQRPLKVLNQALSGREWLISERFSVADLNVASVMQLMRQMQIPLDEYPEVARWLAACEARPALARARARG